MIWYVVVAVIIIAGSLWIAQSFKNQYENDERAKGSKVYLFLLVYPLIALGIGVGIRMMFDGNMTITGTIMFPLGIFFFGLHQLKKGRA